MIMSAPHQGRARLVRESRTERPLQNPTPANRVESFAFSVLPLSGMLTGRALPVKNLWKLRIVARGGFGLRVRLILTPVLYGFLSALSLVG